MKFFKYLNKCRYFKEVKFFVSVNNFECNLYGEFVQMKMSCLYYACIIRVYIFKIYCIITIIIIY